ncbi:MAG: hypothetical protein GX811_11515 [Lentisphaerae bacterium]|nr:hypothetical protein [Lentisphaerota bacterium]
MQEQRRAFIVFVGRWWWQKAKREQVLAIAPCFSEGGEERGGEYKAWTYRDESMPDTVTP